MRIPCSLRPRLPQAATMECSYHVHRTGGASRAREDAPLVPTDVGRAQPQVRAAAWRAAVCSVDTWECAPQPGLLVCGSSKRRSSGRTSAVRSLPGPLRGFPPYAPPFLSSAQSGPLRVHIRWWPPCTHVYAPHTHTHSSAICTQMRTHVSQSGARRSAGRAGLAGCALAPCLSDALSERQPGPAAVSHGAFCGQRGGSHARHEEARHGHALHRGPDHGDAHHGHTKVSHFRWTNREWALPLHACFVMLC
jgi:hypothetical protein